MKTNQVYYTLLIPFDDSPKSTQWHPTTPRGPFATLTRGVFSTVESAYTWARENLNDTAYSVKAYYR